jgi:hypothetical protein
MRMSSAQRSADLLRQRGNAAYAAADWAAAVDLYSKALEEASALGQAEGTAKIYGNRYPD